MLFKVAVVITVSRLKQISTEINLEIPRNIRKSQGVYRLQTTGNWDRKRDLS